MTDETMLNGCVIAYSYDRLSKRCRACIHKDYCDEKSKEKQGVLATTVILPTKNDFLEGMSRIGIADISTAAAHIEVLSKLTCLMGTNIRTQGGTER